MHHLTGTPGATIRVITVDAFAPLKFATGKKLFVMTIYG